MKGHLTASSWRKHAWLLALIVGFFARDAVEMVSGAQSEMMSLRQTVAKTASRALGAFARRKGCSAPPQLDYVEIGTADVSTILQDVDKIASNHGAAAQPLPTGVSVDALSSHLVKLPNHPTNVKVEAAMVGYQDHDATLPFFYITDEAIAQHFKGDEWLNQCAALGAPHELLNNLLKERGLTSLMQRKEVPVLSVQELFEAHGACRIRLLKVDIEGLDYELLMGYVAWLWAHPECYANILRFENHERAAMSDALLAALGTVGYDVVWSAKGKDSIYEYSQARDGRVWAARALAAEAAGLAKESGDAEDAATVAALQARIEAAGGFPIARVGGISKAEIYSLFEGGGSGSKQFAAVVSGLAGAKCAPKPAKAGAPQGFTENPAGLYKWGWEYGNSLINEERNVN